MCSYGDLSFYLFKVMPSEQENNKVFNSISRSHLYWGRKPTSGLLRVLGGLRPGDIFLDPFCGGGTPSIAALHRGARVIASDLNPMAVFLSKTLIQSISVFALKEAFESIRDNVADSIVEKYSIPCPKCRKEISFDYLKWNSKKGEEIPEAVKVRCTSCGLNELAPLSRKEGTRQRGLSEIQPKFWFPKNPIQSKRKTRVEYFHELFTRRNLASLSELWHAINKTPSVRCRETLQYVFTAMLYSCSSMQMFSEKGLSSRGWNGRGFYLPSVRQEKNVWQAFKNRLKALLMTKEIVNAYCKFVRISDSMEAFESSYDHAYVYETDYSNFSFPKSLDVAHVFLDPPYNDDIDYMGLSEFWTCWLRMDSHIESGRHPGSISVEKKADRVLGLLQRIRDNTASSCLVTLAYGSKRPIAREMMEETISKAGYEIGNKLPVIRGNSRKRGKTASHDQYLLLQRASKKAKPIDYTASEKDANELIFFIRVAAFLRPDISNPEGVIDLADHLVQPYLKIPLRQVNKSSVRSWISDRELNRKAYNRLAFVFIKQILLRDGFRIVFADTSRFDDSGLKGYENMEALPMPPDINKGADFVAENGKGRRIIFSLYDESKVDVFRGIANRVFLKDDDFSNICYLVMPNQAEMTKCRHVVWADNWPRGFFIGFNKLVEKAIEIDATRFGHIRTKTLKIDYDIRRDMKIGHFKAKVLRNAPVVIGKGDPKQFKIRFQAPQLQYVAPGQFVMIDTLPYDKRRDVGRQRPMHTLAGLNSKSSHHDIIDLSPRSFLKRPFSIHRAFYPNFERNYLKNISLPPALASITHTVFPHEFEIF